MFFKHLLYCGTLQEDHLEKAQRVKAAHEARSRNDKHKRALSANSSCLPVSIKQEPTSGSLCSPRLQRHGYVQFTIPDNTVGTLSIAVGAFQAQLEVVNKQPPQNRHVGFQQLARKQRLEFRAGHSALGQLGLLQGLATTVRDLHSRLNRHLDKHYMHACPL